MGGGSGRPHRQAALQVVGQARSLRAASQHDDAEGDVLNGKPDASPDCGLPNCVSMDTDSGGKLWSHRVWCL